MIFFYVGKKKKLKSKTKTVSLNEFLSEGPNTSPQTLPPLRTTSWADETDDLQEDGKFISLNSYNFTITEICVN